MRVLVTGHQGYIGPIMLRRLLDEGHEVTGLDTGLFVAGHLEAGPSVPAIALDLRDVTAEDLAGFDAVVHLAGLSNDPLGTLDPALTHAINVGGTLQLARTAKAAGVRRFVFSSSCSVYGAAEEPWVDETTPTRPVTAYGESKAIAEIELAALADQSFCVTSLRNATAFGYSPYLRSDIVVNDLSAGAFLSGSVRLNSDGSAWRPLVHIRDIAQAFARTLAAPVEQVNGAIFNVGSEDQNYRIIDVARAVVDLVPGAELSIAAGAGADKRSYRVRFDRISQHLPGFRCEYDVRAGVEELIANFRRVGLTSTEGCVRLAHLKRLLAAGDVAVDLRPRALAVAGTEAAG